MYVLLAKIALVLFSDNNKLLFIVVPFFEMCSNLNAVSFLDFAILMKTYTIKQISALTDGCSVILAFLPNM